MSVLDSTVTTHTEIAPTNALAQEESGYSFQTGPNVDRLVDGTTPDGGGLSPGAIAAIVVAAVVAVAAGGYYLYRRKQQQDDIIKQPVEMGEAGAATDLDAEDVEDGDGDDDDDVGTEVWLPGEHVP